MLNTRHSREFWILAITALVVLAAGIGLRDPWPADEPRFALVAKHMVESGNWLFPHRGNELYSDKPPMLMWFEAGFYSVFGNWRIAFLLPSLLASLATLWCVYDLGKRLWTPRVGLYAAWALLLAFQFVYQGKKAQIDPLVVFWMTLANYGLLRHFLLGPNLKLWMLGWFAAGLGTITKGVGALALLMILPMLWAQLRGWPHRSGTPQKGYLRPGYFAAGIIAFIAAVSVWLVPMLIAVVNSTDPAFKAYAQDILFNQTAKRYAKSWDHAQPTWYFLGVMLSIWMPTVLALLWAIPAWARRLKRRDMRYLLPLTWWALLVLFFSIPSGKRDVYIMPALPMMCLALGPLLPGIIRKVWANRLAIGFATVLSLVFLICGLGLFTGQEKLVSKLADGRDLHDDIHAFAALLTAMGSWGLAAVLWFRVRRGVIGLTWMLCGIWILYGIFAYPLLNGASSTRTLMSNAGQRIGPDAQLALVGWKEQNLLMADRPATTFGFKRVWTEQLADGAQWLQQSPQSRWILVQERAMYQCIDRDRAIMVGEANRRRYWLFQYDAWIPGCIPQSETAEGGEDG